MTGRTVTIFDEYFCFVNIDRNTMYTKDCCISLDNFFMKSKDFNKFNYSEVLNLKYFKVHE